jgi:hypothetical protein
MVKVWLNAKNVMALDEKDARGAMALDEKVCAFTVLVLVTTITTIHASFAKVQEKANAFLVMVMDIKIAMNVMEMVKSIVTVATAKVNFVVANVTAKAK